MSFSRCSRAVLALATNNWLSRCYLAAVVLVTGLTLWEEVFAIDRMTFVLPMLLTAPLNMLVALALFWVPTNLPFYLGVAIGALVNSTILGAMVRAVRRRSSASPFLTS
jgi:hypothetical protein